MMTIDSLQVLSLAELNNLDSKKIPRPLGYTNGNYFVRFNAGYRFPRLVKTTFRSNEEFDSEFPDSIDLKITNYCSWGCSFCHESSDIFGKHFNLDHTKELLTQIPNVPVEIAIGGGNVLECPEIVDFLSWINEDTLFQPRVTISIKDIEKYKKTDDISYKKRFEYVMALISGLGVSIYDHKSIQKLEGVWLGQNVPICHVILGICKPNDLKNLIYHADEHLFPVHGGVLVLGYKQHGRAKNSQIPKKLIEESKKILLDAINGHTSIACSICFDNLAIEQLGLSEINVPGWNRYYMGEEGKHSMYIDAVEETFAKTSRSDKRVSWKDMGLIEYFNKQKNDTDNY